MQWTSDPDEWGSRIVILDDDRRANVRVKGDDSAFLAASQRPAAAAALAGPDHVVVPRAELVALYGDAPVDVPVIRRVLGETT